MELEKITDSRLKELTGKELNIIVDNEKYSGRLLASEDSNKKTYQLIYRKDKETIINAVNIGPENLFKQNGFFVFKTKNSNDIYYFY